VAPARLARRLRARAYRWLSAGKPASSSVYVPASLIELYRSGPAALVDRRPAADAALRVAVVIPSFRRGSGGHATVTRIVEALARRGHSISLWLEDAERRHTAEPRATTEDSFREFFGTESVALNADFTDWAGADVVLATGWQTVARSMLLDGVAARAYLVQDHEPDFYGASAERLWAAETYRHGLHCIAASRWLAELLRSRYDASASHFDLAVDHTIYRPTAERRREDLVVFYARPVTPRRAVPLGIAALAELSRRRPRVEIFLYGEERPLDAPFASTHLGVLEGPALARLYSGATAGMVLSLTNPSLTGLEMMACGLPCVELASEPVLTTFGSDSPLELSEPDPLSLCDALERLLDEPGLRARAAAAGLQLLAERTWEKAAEQVEEGLRVALRAAA
jgi:glycosyltransferase involved in cell wall biosynthesis